MGGILSAISGFGGAALAHGEHIRGILEKRRGELSDIIGNAATSETDPQTRAALLQHQADLLAGKPIGKITQNFSSTMQKRLTDMQALHEGHQAIAQMIGSAPEPPPEPAGPAAPGQTPGRVGTQPSGGGASFGAASAPPAAQPTSSPLQPSGPIQAPPESSLVPGLVGVHQADLQPPAAPQAIPPVSVTPPVAPFDPRAMRAKILSDAQAEYASSAPAMRPFVIEKTKELLGQLQPFEQQAMREHELAAFKATPGFAALPPFVQSAYEAQAHMFAPVSVPGMAGAMFGAPHTLHLDATEMSPEDKSSYGIPPAATGKWSVDIDRMTKAPIRAVQGWAGTTTTTDTTGNRATVSTNAQLGSGAVPNVSPGSNRVVNEGVDSSGHIRLGRVGDVLQGIEDKGTSTIPSAGVSPSTLGTTTTQSSVTSPSGVHTATTTRQRIAPPGAPASGGVTPVPRGPGVPSTQTLLPKTPAPIRPLDPANELDHKVIALATDAQMGGHLITNAQDKDRVNRRMAELGLQPGMITSSMRDRAKNARLILGHLTDINSIINQADKDGDLGVVATRWNDFLTNKLGSDPTKTQVFAKLSSELGFLSTAVSMAHGGLRGGSSPTMVEHWEKALDAKDPQTLRAKLGEAKKWMEGYATLDRGMADISALPGAGPDVNALRKKYNY